MSVGTGHPVTSPHLDDTDPDEDTGGDSIQGTDGKEGGPVVAVEGVQNADADSHTDGGDEGKDGSQTELLLHRERQRSIIRGAGRVVGLLDGLVRVRSSGRRVSMRKRAHNGNVGRVTDGSDTGTKRNALEDLMEEDDDEQGDEKAVTGNNKSETDHYAPVSYMHSYMTM